MSNEIPLPAEVGGPVAAGTGERGLLARITDIGLHVGAWILVFTMLVIVVNAGMRYLFSASMHVVIELSGFAFLYMTFFAAAGTFLRGGHVVVELVTGVLPPRIRLIVRDILMSVAGIFFVLLLTWAGTVGTWRLIEAGTTTISTMPVPLWPVLIIMPIGSLFLLMAIIAKLRPSIGRLLRGEGAAE
ncbi:MAG: TRAP transporter small permease [Azospirillaceae bacterium]